MSTDSSQSTSTELSGGAGFNYEDLVVGYYLAALLSDGPAAGVPGIVRSVAVQQAAVHPMDDLVVELEDQVGVRVLGLQIKRPLRITAAASNTDFRKVLDAAVATRKMPSFQAGRDVYGFIAEHVAVKSFRSFHASSIGRESMCREPISGAVSKMEEALLRLKGECAPSYCH